jgi:hypothetical protein
MTRNAMVQAHVIMDYPRDGEIITSSDYTFRLSASDEAQMVEVSIDGGPWQECRKAGGHFWFDWAHYMSGRHEIAGRAWLFSDQVEEAGSRHVHVNLEQKAKKH